MVKDAHSKSVIHDQLIAEKEKQKALRKKKADQKRVNDEKKKWICVFGIKHILD